MDSSKLFPSTLRPFPKTKEEMKGFIRNYSLGSAACLRSGCLRSSPSSGEVRGRLPGEDLLLTELHSVIIPLDNECSGLIGTGFRKKKDRGLHAALRRKPGESGVEKSCLGRKDAGGSQAVRTAVCSLRDAEQVCSCSGPLRRLVRPQHWGVGTQKPLLMG